jgi:hypothetical protein
MQGERNPKLVELLDKMLSGYDPVAAIVESEEARGFKVIRPGNVPWFQASDWRAASVASIHGVRARLVLLHAVESGRGAMTRTIAGVKAAGLLPVVVEPTRELAATLSRRGWKPHDEGTTFEDCETVWTSSR